MKPIIFAIMLCAGIAKGETQNQFLIGYIDHPRMANHYKNIIAAAYDELGISVKFFPVGSKRGLTLLNEGLIDADVTRFGQVTQIYNNIIKVEPPILSDASISLFCFGVEVCDIDAIDNELVATTLVFQENAAYRHGEQKRSFNTISVESIVQLQMLIENRRVRYAMLIHDDDIIQQYTSKGFKHDLMFTGPAYHLIHKKHEHLVERLSAALKRQLDKWQHNPIE